MLVEVPVAVICSRCLAWRSGVWEIRDPTDPLAFCCSTCGTSLEISLQEAINMIGSPLIAR